MSRSYKETKLTTRGQAYEKEIDERFTMLDINVLTKEVKESLEEQEKYSPKVSDTPGDPGNFRRLFSLPVDILTPIMAIVWGGLSLLFVGWLIWFLFF